MQFYYQMSTVLSEIDRKIYAFLIVRYAISRVLKRYKNTQLQKKFRINLQRMHYDQLGSSIKIQDISNSVNIS